ncbi:MAG TPA: S41 family peptidase, partial [Limnochordales bacterium]
NLVGVGIVIVQTEAGEVLVRGVVPGGPAARAGVRRGERIASVDGQPTAGRSLDEVALSIRGQPQTTVRLELVGPDGRRRELLLKRQPYTYDPKVQARVLPGEIGYLYLPGFREGMETAFLGELRRLYRTKALVLDLRDSTPGGSLATLMHIAGLLSREPLGLLVSREGMGLLEARRAETSDNPLVPAPTELDFYGRPLALLVDETSRFHELAFGLRENRRAVLVGRPMTAGGGQVQSCSPLPGGGEVCVTSMRFFSLRGRPLVGPVVPDVVVPVDELFLKRWAQGGDLDLEKAVEVLRRQLQAS